MKSELLRDRSNMSDVLPDEVRTALIRILQTALLSIRAHCWSGCADIAAMEADHVHNLPGVLMSNSYGALEYYFYTEVAEYRQAYGERASRRFSAEWNIIEAYLRTQDGMNDRTSREPD